MPIGIPLIVNAPQYAGEGAINSDAGVQGLPCDGVVQAGQALHSLRNFKHRTLRGKNCLMSFCQTRVS